MKARRFAAMLDVPGLDVLRFVPGLTRDAALAGSRWRSIELGRYRSHAAARTAVRAALAKRPDRVTYDGHRGADGYSGAVARDGDRVEEIDAPDLTVPSVADVGYW